MLLLSLDLASSTGWALFEYDRIPCSNPKLIQYGTLKNTQKVKDHGAYPWSILYACRSVAEKVIRVVEQYKPDRIAIEEVNQSRQRISQKFLGGLHYAVLEVLAKDYEGKVDLISTSEWRRVMSSQLTKEDRAQNAKLSVAKSKAKKAQKTLNKKELGISGKVTVKHVAIRRVNEIFGTCFTATQDDVCDAILEGAAYLMGAKICDGK